MQTNQNFREKISLNEAKIGVIYRIKNISTALSPKIFHHLLEFGFIPNEKIKVLQKSLLGQTFLIEILNSTLIIEKKLALNIEIFEEK